SAPFLFFFQAEDGIRDFHVTGVQTCAPSDLMSSTEAPARKARPRTVSHSRDFGRGFFVKLALVALVDVLDVYIAMMAFGEGAMGVFWGMVAVLVAVNWVYFSRRTLPMKY